MSDYIKLTEAKAIEEKKKHEKIKGRLFKDKGKEYMVMEVGLMPANPDVRNKLWTMTTNESIPEQTVNEFATSLKETEFTVCLISRQLVSPLSRPEMRLDELRYVVRSGVADLELGFALSFQPPL